MTTTVTTTRSLPRMLALRFGIVVLFVVGFIFVVYGVAGANPVDVSWKQGCVATYVKKLDVILHNEWSTDLPVTIVSADSPFTVTVKPGETKTVNVYTADTTHGAGSRPASVSSTVADLHGTLAASLTWTDHECGPPVETTAPAPTTTVPGCPPGQHYETYPPSGCYPDHATTTTAPPPPPASEEPTTVPPTVEATTVPPVDTSVVKTTPKPTVPKTTPPTTACVPGEEAPGAAPCLALPTTGGSPAPMTLAGFGALLGGAALVIVTRRHATV